MTTTVKYTCNGCGKELVHPIHAYGQTFGDGATKSGIAGDWHACSETCTQNVFESMSERARTAARAASGKSPYGGGK